MDQKLVVLVCGGRNYSDYPYMRDILNTIKIRAIITGMARGADILAYRYAKQNQIPTLEFPANWNRHGRSAGFIRNQEMLNKGQPDLVVAFPGGNGTAHMVRISKAAGIKTIEIPARPTLSRRISTNESFQRH